MPAVSDLEIDDPSGQHTMLGLETKPGRRQIVHFKCMSGPEAAAIEPVIASRQADAVAAFRYRPAIGVHWLVPATNFSTLVLPVSPKRRTANCAPPRPSR